MADRLEVKVRQRRRILESIRKAQRHEAERSDRPSQADSVDHLIDFDDTLIPPGSMGLALSGGGIRSATICLGLLQSFSRHRRLLDFDYLSTVSGGGYAGSFLRSLFVPLDERGATPTGTGTAHPSAPSAAQAEKTIRFVEEVLTSASKQEQIDDPQMPGGKIRNPIWWLREHGRYLAPNGPTDFGFGVAYIARNWMAMIYTFMIACMSVFLALFWLEWEINAWLGKGLYIARISFGERQIVISPLLVVLAVPLFASIAAGIGYWTTNSLPVGNSWKLVKPRSAPKTFWAQWIVLALIACSAVAGLVEYKEVSGLTSPYFWQLSWPGFGFCLALELVAVGLVIAAAAAGYTTWLILWEHSNDIFTSELRRRMTKICDGCNSAIAVLFCLTLVDSVALALKGPLGEWIETYRLSAALGVLGPVAAWTITKLPQWFAGGTLVKWFGEHIWTVTRCWIAALRRCCGR